MSTIYQIPPVQGESALHQAISLMLHRYMQEHSLTIPADPAMAPGILALHFARWLFDNPEELKAATIEIEGKTLK